MPAHRWHLAPPDPAQPSLHAVHLAVAVWQRPPQPGLYWRPGLGGQAGTADEVGADGAAQAMLQQRAQQRGGVPDGVGWYCTCCW